MIIKSEKSYAIVGTTICDINNREMRQMHELKIRIKDVLDSHKSNSKEKKYICDEDLNLMHAILSVFTKDYSSTQTSAFDDFLKEQAREEGDEVHTVKHQSENQLQEVQMRQMQLVQAYTDDE